MPASKRRPYIVRLVRSHPLLTVALVIGLLVFALPSERRLAHHALVAWDAGTASYLVLVYGFLARSRVSEIRRRASLEDEGRTGILVLTVAAALASLAAIVVELGSSSNGGRPHAAELALATATIVLSWAFIHTIFALHYAHEFYGDGDSEGGLQFPGGGEPDYWDFVYFSFVIGMTSQVSDVMITSRSIRRAATAHGVTSFLFNAALLALTVNIAASAI